jgi:hypothetical protein
MAVKSEIYRVVPAFNPHQIQQSCECGCTSQIVKWIDYAAFCEVCWYKLDSGSGRPWPDQRWERRDAAIRELELLRLERYLESIISVEDRVWIPIHQLIANARIRRLRPWTVELEVD